MGEEKAWEKRGKNDLKKRVNRSVQLLWLYPDLDYSHIKFRPAFFLCGEISIFCACVQGGLSARIWSGTMGHKGLCIIVEAGARAHSVCVSVHNY